MWNVVVTIRAFRLDLRPVTSGVERFRFLPMWKRIQALEPQSNHSQNHVHCDGGYVHRKCYSQYVRQHRCTASQRLCCKGKHRRGSPCSTREGSGCSGCAGAVRPTSLLPGSQGAREPYCSIRTSTPPHSRRGISPIVRDSAWIGSPGWKFTTTYFFHKSKLADCNS